MFRQDHSADDNRRPMVGARAGVHAECKSVNHKPILQALAAESAASSNQRATDVRIPIPFRVFGSISELGNDCGLWAFTGHCACLS
jgi:hypothetical protein